MQSTSASAYFFSSLQMLIGLPKRPPIAPRLRPGGADALSIFDLITGLIPFTPSGLINMSVLHAYYWLTAWKVQSSSHTLHLAAQLLNSLCGGFVVMWELLPGGNRVGTGAVWQAALWGALVRRSLLLPVEMVFHQELQLWSSGKKWRWKVSDKSKVGRMGGAVPVGNVGRTRTSVVGKWCEMKPANGRAALVKGEAIQHIYKISWNKLVKI